MSKLEDDMAAAGIFPENYPMPEIGVSAHGVAQRVENHVRSAGRKIRLTKRGSSGKVDSMKSSGTLPKGFTCDCGIVHQFSPYVYAHWNILLVMTCDCKRRYEIQNGLALQVVDSKGLVKHDKP